MFMVQQVLFQSSFAQKNIYPVILFFYLFINIYVFCRTCAECQDLIRHESFVQCIDSSVWHSECFRCFACNKTISDNEV